MKAIAIFANENARITGLSNPFGYAREYAVLPYGSVVYGFMTPESETLATPKFYNERQEKDWRDVLNAARKALEG